MFRKVAALVAPFLLFAACANEGEPGAIEVNTGDAAVSALRSAPDAAAEAGTAQFEMVMDVGTRGESLDMTASGAFDTAAGQMSMTMDMGALFEQLAGLGGEAVPADVGGAWEFASDKGTFYLRVPLFEMFTGSTDWLSLSAEELGTSADRLGLGAGTYDPSKLLESLRGVTGEPEVVGHEEVRGVPTTHYRATLDLSQALDDAPADQRAQIEAALEQLGDLESAVIPVDIWIDDNDLPRRMAIDMGGAIASLAGEDVSMTMTLEVFDYGEAVDIAIPSADETTPLSEVMGGFGGFGDLDKAS
jgi:hypothetical protein